MRTLTRFALSIGATALFTGCGGSQSPIGVSGAMPQIREIAPRGAGNTPGTQGVRHYKVLFSFDESDGAWPSGDLIMVDGTLYGTTYTGGLRFASCVVSAGCGTVFSVTPSGTEKVLYEFKGGSDGGQPEGGLADVNGTLYGTTYDGGGSGCRNQGCGTVFSVTTGGKERVLHRFASATGGESPLAGLVNVRGTLYGTTGYEGYSSCTDHLCGAVFSITTSGKERVLYRFRNPPDGNEPAAPLKNVNGILYGTTFTGGALCASASGSGCGTVFSITTAGKEQVLYRFGGDAGAFPSAGVIDVNGILYGTTEQGGADGSGTVFSLSTAGQEHVLYSFQGDNSLTHSYGPNSGLINRNGTLYGTTYGGGAYGSGQAGFGTIFSVTTVGQEQTLHNFAGPPDGNGPAAGLTALKGTFYGTTFFGGVNGWGTVFALKP